MAALKAGKWAVATVANSAVLLVVMMAETSAVEKAVLKAELTAAQSVAGMAVRMVD